MLSPLPQIEDKDDRTGGSPDNGERSNNYGAIAFNEGRNSEMLN